MYRLEKQYRSTVSDVSRSSIFRSFLFCKDDHNQLCIVGARTPFLANYSLPHLQCEILSKRHISQAIIRAQSRGRMQPNHQDMYSSRPVRFKVVSKEELPPTQYVDVYMLI